MLCGIYRDSLLVYIMVMCEKEYWKEHWESDPRLSSDNPFYQVGRTQRKKPISPEDWARSLKFIEQYLLPNDQDVLIDLCCGNGLLSDYFCNLVSEIIAIDYSKRLLDVFVAKERSNVHTLQRDVKKLSFEDLSFNKVLFHFAAQHFSEGEILRILQRIKKSIAPGGLIYIGEIPDVDRKWNFYSTKEYKDAYFDGLIKDEPIIGTWYKKEFFEYAAESLGFTGIKILDQPKFMLNQNHRFDVLIRN